MCGIAGFLLNDYGRGKIADKKNIIYSMLEVIKSRGPDDEGHWIDTNEKIVLGHKRLSIQDLSNAGHQPMVSSNRRYVITYNGEIYNHLEIRTNLQTLGHSINWKGGSDTESILESISSLGIESTLNYCEGMFAFALWDNQKRELYLARDRF